MGELLQVPCWDAVCFCETRASKADSILMGGHRLITHRGTSYGGVAILLHESWAIGMVAKLGFGERVLAVRVKTSNFKITIISVYMPHAGYPHSAIRECYTNLRNAVSWAREFSQLLVIGGDFNTTLDNVGPRGVLLQEFTDELNIQITNVQAGDDFDKIWTFRSSMGIRRRLDYILAGPALTVEHSFASGLLDLGSDHRSVFAELTLNTKTARTQQIQRNKTNSRWVPFDGYEAVVENSIWFSPPGVLSDVEQLLVNADASRDAASSQSTCTWTSSAGLQALRQKRSTCRDQNQKKQLSKVIQQLVRAELRKVKSERVASKLREFKDLGDLHSVHRLPTKKTMQSHQPPDNMGDFMGKLFRSDGSQIAFQPEVIRSISPILLSELTRALKQMSKGKCCDKASICLEMIAHGGMALHQCLVQLYNNILKTGQIESSWKETFFTMLPKSGDLGDPGNWRPIAVLRVCYKVFGRIVYNRLRPNLQGEQSYEQMGFMQKRSTEDALLILEEVISKCLDQHVPLWFASLDLAFDRIEWQQLFEALQEQGVPLNYQHLLMLLYDGQEGVLSGDKRFPIQRGVRQGDVLSTLLFNAASEMVIRRWKTRLASHGLKISGDNLERLTNVRFADDLIIYANSLAELTEMIDMLVEEFCIVGLELNTKKSKFFTLDGDIIACDSPILVEAGGGFIEVARRNEKHTYLGNAFAGNLRHRGKGILDNRLRCAWSKFHMFRHSLTNKHVDIKLRLRLFDAVVSPAVLYGLSTAPLTSAAVECLAIAQRKMLRLIVGYVKLDGDSWADMYRRLRQKLATAMDKCSVKEWPEELTKRKQKLWNELISNSRSPLVTRVFQWSPMEIQDPKLPVRPFRARGHPWTTWQQHIDT